MNKLMTVLNTLKNLNKADLEILDACDQLGSLNCEIFLVLEAGYFA